MNTRLLPHFAAFAIASASFLTPALAQPLASNAGPLTMNGTNGTSYVNFSTALDSSKDTFAEFIAGDSITLSFTLSYTRTSSTNLGSTSIDFGFVSSASSLLYANLQSNVDSINATSSSQFRSREGSRFFSNGTTQRLQDVNAFSTAFMHNTDTATTETYSVSLAVTKTSDANYLLELNIGGNLFSDTVSFTAAALTDEQVISGVGFRNNNAFLTAPSLTNISVSFSSVPEPSSYALLAGGGVLALAAYLRRRSC